MSKREITIITILIQLFSVFIVFPARAQELDTELGPFIYRISAKNCEHAPKSRVQTGFAIVQDDTIWGIVTALHGVLDCKEIKAIPENAIELSPLNISHVDTTHDIALLKPTGERTLFQGVKNFRPSFTISCGSTRSTSVIILGYKNAAQFTDKRGGTISCTRALKQKLSNDPENPESRVRDALKERKSPDLDISIFDVKVNVAHGDSGAPIFEENTDTLLGMVIGGIGEGNGWGIPWHTIQWKSVKEQKDEIARIKALNITDVLLSHLGYISSLTNSSTVDIQVNNQPWKGDFKIEKLAINQATCVIITTTPSNDDKKIVLAEQVFLEPGTFTDQTISMFGTPTKEEQGRFCDLLFEASQNRVPVQLFAYLAKWNGNSCDTMLMTNQNKPVTIFTINTNKTQISKTGFCTDPTIWNSTNSHNH